jgi:hypothetical protein
MWRLRHPLEHMIGAHLAEDSFHSAALDRTRAHKRGLYANHIPKELGKMSPLASGSQGLQILRRIGCELQRSHVATSDILHAFPSRESRYA